MATTTTFRAALALSFLAFSLPGCGADGNAANETDATDAEETASDCIPGEERCTCNEGRCLEGLACLSDVCVEPPPLDPSETSGSPPPDSDSDSASDDGTGTGGDDFSCGSIDDCSSTEVCDGGYCVDAQLYPYELRVWSFNGCVSDGFGAAELYYEAWNGDGVVQSPVSSCPANWPKVSAPVPAPSEEFQLSFWEADAVFDDFLTRLCWGDPADPTVCGPVPSSVLHDGLVDVCWDADASCATLEFARCSCALTCDKLGDCCPDFETYCGSKSRPGNDPEYALVSGNDSSATPEPTLVSLPSSSTFYPDLGESARAALASEDALSRLAGLRDAFAASRPRLRDWNRFGAISLEGGFVSLEGEQVSQQDGTSLGCLGGVVEAVRVLETPTLSLSEVMQAPHECPLDREEPACLDEHHTGVHALVNMQSALGEEWKLDLARLGADMPLDELLVPQAHPYFIAASHISKNDGQRWFHHMLAVVVDEDGPVIFDVTGLRGMSLRRTSWRELERYVHGTLAGSDYRGSKSAGVSLAMLHR